MGAVAKGYEILAGSGFLELCKQVRITALRNLHHFLWDQHFEPYEAVPTSGYLDADDLYPIDMTNHTALINYVPTPRLVVSWLIDSLDVDYAQYSFVDIGSGRGRVLLAAAQKPFRQIEGVEYSCVLHREAQENIKCYSYNKLGCKSIRSVCQDAAKYDLPPGDCIVFLFNPFEATLLNQLIGNLLDQMQASGNNLKIIYLNPAYGDDVASHSRLTEFEPNMATKFKMAMFSPYAVRMFHN